MKSSMLIILLAAAVLAACTTSRQKNETPFAVTEAIVQEQLPGVQGAGTSREYRFKAIISTNNSLVFDSVWVDGKKLPVKLLKQDKLLQDASALAAGDTVVLAASHYEPGAQEFTDSTEQASTAKWPVLAKGDALIRFYVNNQPAYYTIVSLTKLPPVILP